MGRHGPGRWLGITVAIVAALWGGNASAPAAEVPGRTTYLAMFLEPSDVPPGMRRIQDSRDKGPRAGDLAYAKHGGEQAGLAIWMGAPGTAVWRLADIRWLFATDTGAAAYHRATLGVNSEGYPEVPSAPKVGSECRVFGGTRFEPALSRNLTQYFYIFRVGRAVVKLHVAQGPAVEGVMLTPGLVKPIADKAAARIRGRLK
ncbi:MAG: hypothetical protein HYY95_17435 [Candidatus Rokubacteria bacterium]|nr:hypothetical protein [Candidatus Rokubacteria bacterium]MBI3107320.1 hypothetical protein [Candidatus Rokubacteria bacterium]